MIPGSTPHRSRCYGHRNTQGSLALPYMPRTVVGELENEWGFDHGGGELRVEEGFRPGACSGEIEGRDGSAEPRGGLLCRYWRGGGTGEVVSFEARAAAVGAGEEGDGPLRSLCCLRRLTGGGGEFPTRRGSSREGFIARQGRFPWLPREVTTAAAIHGAVEAGKGRWWSLRGR
jgi:hypothetical protein